MKASNKKAYVTVDSKNNVVVKVGNGKGKIIFVAKNVDHANSYAEGWNKGV